MLDALVDRQQHQGSVAGAELVEKPVESGLLPGGSTARRDFCSDRALSFHYFEDLRGMVVWLSMAVRAISEPSQGRLAKPDILAVQLMSETELRVA